MKRVLLSSFIALVACLLLATSASAQKKYKLNTHDAVSKIAAGDTIGSVRVIISNNTKDTFSIKWQLLGNSFVPTGWFYGYCDLNQCYTGTIPTSGINQMDTFGPKAFHVDIYNTYGNDKQSAKIKLRIYQLSLPSQADTIILEFQPLSSVAYEPEIASSVNIYPNPADKQLFLDIAGNAYKPVSANITNILGQNIRISTGMLQSGKIDISDLRTGVYFLRMADNNGVIVTKTFEKR